MANLFSTEDRRVVPNWRSFGKTTVLRELDSFQLEREKKIEPLSIEEYIIDWKLNGGVVFASDLLSAAIVNNRTDNPSVNAAAHYILSNKDQASYSQLSLANRIIKPLEDKELLLRPQQSNIENILSSINPKPIHEKINILKNSIRKNPLNSISYVEIARYYSILGQEEKAIHSINIALIISPDNRFILRSATRLYTHFATTQNDYLLRIHRLLNKNPITKYDPWLLSAEITVATILKKNSQLIKKGLEMISSKNIDPFAFTELASSIATVELLNGSSRKSKMLFEKALIKPNDNTLAQIEWASIKDNRIESNPEYFLIQNNFEAMAIDTFHNQKFELALEYAAKWFWDMPFSKRPIIFASNLASTILGDHDKSIMFLKAGEISHPNDPLILNNLAYAYAQRNNTNEALAALGRITNYDQIENSTKLCIGATRGLIMFRSGKENEGRRLYIEAIEKTKQTNSNELNSIAILNYAREEIIAKYAYIEPIMDMVYKIPEKSSFIEVDILRKQVIELYNTNKTQPNNI